MQEIEQFIPRGYCRSCRGCCRFSQPAGAWKPHFLDLEERVAEFVRIVPSKEPGENNFVCACLDPGTSACEVYAQRPLECRLYPFLLERQEDGLFLVVDERCPYVSERSESGEFSSYVARLEAFFAGWEWQEILQRNRERFQSYPGVRRLGKVAP